jgi:hypothetical protein
MAYNLAACEKNSRGEGQMVRQLLTSCQTP